MFDDFSAYEKLKIYKPYDKFELKHFATSGYTSKNNTIYKDVKQVGPGQLVEFYNNKIKNPIL